jgi:hypothetical protein
MSDLNRFLTKKEKKTQPNQPSSLEHKKKRPKIINRGGYPLALEQLSKTQLISLLEPLMTEIPSFVANLAWTRQKILPQNQKIHPEELAQKLSIPLLEAYIILAKLRSM